MSSLVLVFIGFSFVVQLILLFMLFFRKYGRWFLVPLSLLTAAIPLRSYAAWVCFGSGGAGYGVAAFGAFSFVVMLSLVELVTTFLREDTQQPTVAVAGVTVPLRWIFRSVALLGIGISLFSVWAYPVVPAEDGTSGLLLLPSGVVMAWSEFVLLLGFLFTLENTYRFARPYHRKIGRFCFLGMLVIGVFHGIYLTRILLYQTVTVHYIETSMVVQGISFPVILLGLIRYRLSTEKISIPRETVYSSITLFVVGALFLGIGSSVFIVQRLGYQFSYFERFFIVFSLAFLIVLLVGSGDMRKRIIRFANAQLFSHKYDYRDQFFRLHHTYMATDSFADAVTELVENLKYSVTVDDAFVFLLNVQDGNYYMHSNKEAATRRNMVLSGDSAVVKYFENNDAPVDANTGVTTGEGSRALQSEPAVGELKIDALFPIYHSGAVVGVLGVRKGTKKVFDEEDLTLITVFTRSIGDSYFKNRVLRERIEQKQFESFNHIASFIIHDIKNQVATLSLIARNADRNIGNPAFQKSLIGSIKNCAANLDSLIGKLTSPPREEQVLLQESSINPVVQRVLDNAALDQCETLSVQTALAPDLYGAIDETSLFYIVKNLVTNGCEAMSFSGTLSVETGAVETMNETLRRRCGVGDRFVRNFRSYIAVSDTGVGMSREFIENKLFHPFSSTKDKGVGIGLYQCKTLIEKMQGKLVCFSDPGRETTFVILLK